MSNEINPEEYFDFLVNIGTIMKLWIVWKKLKNAGNWL